MDGVGLLFFFRRFRPAPRCKCGVCVRRTLQVALIIFPNSRLCLGHAVRGRRVFLNTLCFSIPPIFFFSVWEPPRNNGGSRPAFNLGLVSRSASVIGRAYLLLQWPKRIGAHLSLAAASAAGLGSTAPPRCFLDRYIFFLSQFYLPDSSSVSSGFIAY